MEGIGLDILIIAVLIVALVSPLAMLPEIGHVASRRLAPLYIHRLDVGPQSGDHIISVDGNATDCWQDIGAALMRRIGDTCTFASRLVNGVIDTFVAGFAMAAAGIGRMLGDDNANLLPGPAVYGAASTSAGLAVDLIRPNSERTDVRDRWVEGDPSGNPESRLT